MSRRYGHGFDDDNFFKEAWGEVPLLFKVLWFGGLLLTAAFWVAVIWLIVVLIGKL